ncbi:activating signal cointegrator 1 complex subunit 1-like [Anoplophora glabripennis]|uniref:activating signal cointegrator 1 complex subunit 1-like n=1 Tax=Anoplophora glabripennis TaxID=217634 RepID=UPI000873D9CB|nr:activating signal cointegrator 1 complex subunit 1-like [Anoplophora glabripennis]
MHAGTTRKQFPDFFTTKGPIQINVMPLKMKNNIYWMSVVLNEDEANGYQQPHLKSYDDNEEGLLDCGDIEDSYDINLTKSGKFMSSFYVPSSLLSYVIGAKGVRLKGLQRSTNTLIKVPKLNEKGEVKITGDTERNVASARTQLSMIVMKQKDKLPISHFVSIPMVSDKVKEKLMEFQDRILRQPPKGVTPSIFQKPEKLHLTICTLTLVDDEEIKAAKEVLQQCYDEIISTYFNKNEKLKIALQGLEIMNDDPSEVNVLYGIVEMADSSQREKLQEIADKIAEYYYKSGLARRQYDRVKLHVTLMNTRFRNADEKPETFDARQILAQFRNYCFGSVDFSNIHLSVRFTTGEDNYYEPAMIINL